MRAAGLTAALLGLFAPVSGGAQVAFGLAATSDLRNRGLSLNGGRPALTASVAYDHPSGLYVGASAVGGDTRRFGVRFLGHSEYAGYAVRLGSRLTGDVGIANTQVESNVFRRFAGRYTEVYAGLGTERFGARLLFSPAYLGSGLSTLYLDVNASVRRGTRLRGFAHAGLLGKVGGGTSLVLPRARYDLRVGAAAGVARSEIQVAWVRTGAGNAYLAPRRQASDAVVVGAAWFF